MKVQGNKFELFASMGEGYIIGDSLSFLGFTVQFALHFELGFFILLVKGLLHD